MGRMKKRNTSLLSTFLVIIALAVYSFFGLNEDPSGDNFPLQITFMDVGQGDSILIQSGDSTMLIDAGPTSASDEIISELEKNNIKKIDILIGTHPHEDHIGSLDTVIQKFDIGRIYMPQAVATTKAYEDVITAVKNKGLVINKPVAGTSLEFGDAECVFLAPNNSTYEDLNNYSIVIKLVYGETSFIFTGDAEALSEKEMLEKGYDLKADVLKVGHHGSSTSTAKDFLESVDPVYAVIMCGKDNSYGHPHRETMEKLKEKGIIVYRTDECGTIVCSSDGENILFNVDPGSYKNGSSK